MYGSGWMQSRIAFLFFYAFACCHPLTGGWRIRHPVLFDEQWIVARLLLCDLLESAASCFLSAAYNATTRVEIADLLLFIFNAGSYRTIFLCA